ncbi:MAG: protein phosphatase 2C domain-containing protein [Pseudomonadota bacterium]|nr:protein phosphatase 2C domain-containing protein [Pseudomonadota bacterium]
MLIWTSAHVSDVGTRRKINEDAVLELPSQGLWAVADGMGGHAAGDYASQLLVRCLSTVDTRNRPIADVVEDIEQLVMKANDQMHSYARQRRVDAVGSTVVVLLLTNQIGVCLWAGDSRLYQVRDNQIQCISNDHSLVQRLIDQGEITREQAATHPSRNVITRAIGADPQVFLDCRVFQPQSGDGYILCSDGLYNEVHEMDMLDLVNGLMPRDAAESMLSVALDDGADDNVSVVVVKIRE